MLSRVTKRVYLPSHFWISTFTKCFIQEPVICVWIRLANNCYYNMIKSNHLMKCYTRVRGTFDRWCRRSGCCLRRSCTSHRWRTRADHWRPDPAQYPLYLPSVHPTTAGRKLSQRRWTWYIIKCKSMFITIQESLWWEKTYLRDGSSRSWSMALSMILATLTLWTEFTLPE